MPNLGSDPKGASVIDPHESGRRLPEVAKHEDDEYFLAAMNAVLSKPIECTAMVPREDLPIIYIVGAPRSGTTLMSQVLSRYLRVGYIDNVIARFWLAPEVGIRLSRILLGHDARESISFKSRHGVTENPTGPHEFGYFWRYWLALDRAPTHHLTDRELSVLDSTGLKHALEYRLLGAFKMPLVFKNVICGFQAPYLTALHPNSIFIHIKRDLKDTAASILKSRFERYGSYATWWSLKPSSFFRLPSDPVEQVVSQVTDCRAEIDEAMSRSGAHTIEVDYAEFCRSPDALLERVCALLGRLGAASTPLGSVEPFSVSGSPVLPAHLKERLESVLAVRCAP